MRLPARAPKEDVVCPTCGTTYEEFVKNSRFGCADCYHVFDPLLGEKIKKLQENSSHTGKHREDPAAQSGGCRGDEERRTGIQPGRAD